MEQILLLILSWIPIPAEIILLIVIFVKTKATVNNAVSLPKKQVKATEDLKEQVKTLNIKLVKMIEENEQLHKDNVDLKLELRGHRKYGKD